MTKEETIRKLIKGGMTAKAACKQENYSLPKWYRRAHKNKPVLRTSVEVSEVQAVTPLMSLVRGTPQQIAEVLRTLS